MMSTSANAPMYTQIQAKLSQALSPTVLEIRDDSHLHAGHAAMKGLNKSETHFHVYVVSEAFTGKLPIERHRMINELLADELNQSVHALQIAAKTPA